MLILTLPYYVNTATIKKPKIMMLGLNSYKALPFLKLNKIKQKYSKMVQELVRASKHPTIEGEYSLHFTLYYKNKLSDLDNICAVVCKFTNDALQESGLVANDNIKNCVKITFEKGEQDRENPRVIIKIIGGDNDSQ